MKTLLASLIVLFSLLGASAVAQSSLPQGVSIANLGATRQADGVWIITSALSNHRDTPVNGLSVTYALYDAHGNEIDRVTSRRDAPLAPGDTWNAQTPTHTDFTRFSAKKIEAQ